MTGLSRKYDEIHHLFQSGGLKFCVHFSTFGQMNISRIELLASSPVPEKPMVSYSGADAGCLSHSKLKNCPPAMSPETIVEQLDYEMVQTFIRSNGGPKK